MLLYNQLAQAQQSPLYSVESYEPIEPPEEKTPNYHYINTAVKDRSPLLNRVNLNLLNIQNISNYNTQAPIVRKLDYDLCLNNNNNVFTENNQGNLKQCNNLIINNSNNILSSDIIRTKINRDINNNNCIRPINTKNSFNYGNNVKIQLYNYIQPKNKLVKSKSSKYLSPFKSKQTLNQKTMNDNKIFLPKKIRLLSPPRIAQNNYYLYSNKKNVPIYRKIVYRRRDLFAN